MRRSITLTTTALAIAMFGTAGAAQAASDEPAPQQQHIKAVVVLIGANDHGLVAPPPTRAID